MADTTLLVSDDESVPVEQDGPRGRLGRPRRDADESRLVSHEQARRLLEQAREEGIDVTGPSGLLQQMMKSVLEVALGEELTDHLGYEPGDPVGRGSGNSRNGATSKTLLTGAGPVELDTPRDRNGTFEPLIVRKGQRRLDGLDKAVLSLYARGMTTRDICAHLLEIYGVEVSPDLISKITDAVHAEVADWQMRPLDSVYPVVFLDALVCKVRDGGSVKNKAAHIAVGVDVDVEGRKEVLGIWVETTEGAKFWLRVMNELKARGVADVLIAVCDGLTGLPDAITAVWPQAKVQTCIVHLIRASLRWVNYNGRKRVAAQLKLIYGAPTEAAARDALDALEDSDIGREYPGIIRRWRESWELVTPFFDFSPEVRKVIYTTNMIESINSELRRSTRNRGRFPATRRCSRSSTCAARRGPNPPRTRPRRQNRLHLEDSPPPVRHHVPRPARTGLTHEHVTDLHRAADTPPSSGRTLPTAPFGHTAMRCRSSAGIRCGTALFCRTPSVVCFSWDRRSSRSATRSSARPLGSTRPGCP